MDTSELGIARVVRAWVQVVARHELTPRGAGAGGARVAERADVPIVARSLIGDVRAPRRGHAEVVRTRVVVGAVQRLGGQTDACSAVIVDRARIAVIQSLALGRC